MGLNSPLIWVGLEKWVIFEWVGNEALLHQQTIAISHRVADFCSGPFFRFLRNFVDNKLLFSWVGNMVVTSNSPGNIFDNYFEIFVIFVKQIIRLFFWIWFPFHFHDSWCCSCVGIWPFFIEFSIYSYTEWVIVTWFRNWHYRPWTW